MKKRLTKSFSVDPIPTQTRSVFGVRLRQILWLPVLTALFIAPGISTKTAWAFTCEGEATLTSTLDTYINQKAKEADRSYGSDDKLSIKFKSNEVKHVLLKYDLSSLPGSATVTSATLGIYVKDKKRNSANIHQMNTYWTESATWNKADGSNFWDSSNGGHFSSNDYNPDLIAVIDNSTAGWKTITGNAMRDMVEQWMNTPAANEGVVLLAGSCLAQGCKVETKDAKYFSREAGDSGKHPYLSVSYTYDSAEECDVTMDAMAVFTRNKDKQPGFNLWNGIANAFGTPQEALPQSERYRVLAGASAPTRNEKIIVGVMKDGGIAGEIWNGTAWSTTGLTSLGTVDETYWWSADVAYESSSGDALLVWNDGSQPRGSELVFKKWDGSQWSSAGVVTAYDGAEPQQMYLTASPHSNEMILVIGDRSGDKHVLVWDGFAWGNALTLDDTGISENDQTGVYAAYEHVTGWAQVVYGKNDDANVYYRTWGGSSWSSEASIAAPDGTTRQVQWLTLAGDANSNNIMLGVLTTGGSAADIWLAVWNGTTWDTPSLLATGSATGSIFPNVAVSFESNSGDALAVYGVNDTASVQFRTWDNLIGWSGELDGPSIGGEPNSMTLDANPGSDQIMLSVQNGSKDLNYVLWSSDSWGAPSEQSGDTGEVKNQPFLFLWD